MDGQLASTPGPWLHYAKFVSMMSPKYSIIENDGELMLMALHAQFLSQQQYSRVYALFHAFYALGYWWECQLLSLFSQDNEHSELMVLFFIQKPFTIFAHILQSYHDFQSNVVIFPSIVQTYKQTYSFSIKLIIYKIRWRTNT